MGTVVEFRPGASAKRETLPSAVPKPVPERSKPRFDELPNASELAEARARLQYAGSRFLTELMRSCSADARATHRSARESEEELKRAVKLGARTFIELIETNWAAEFDIIFAAEHRR
jgi:hypothetical protein